MTNHDTPLTNAILRLSEIARAEGLDVVADDITGALAQIDKDLKVDPMQRTIRLGLAAGIYGVLSVLGTTFLVEYTWLDPFDFLKVFHALVPAYAG